MRLQNNFTNLIKHERSALEADFICDCGCRKFTVTHTGKNGLFGTSINRKHKQLVIKAECRTCHRIHTIYDTSRDGRKPTDVSSSSYSSFTRNGNNVFEISLKYNFLEENFMTDKFESIYIDFKDDKKTYRVYEE